MSTAAPAPSSIIPNRSVPVANADGTVSLPWLRFFQNLSGASISNINSEIAAINTELATLSGEIAAAEAAAAAAAVEPIGQLFGNLALGLQDDIYTVGGLLDGVSILAYLGASLLDQSASSPSTGLTAAAACVATVSGGSVTIQYATNVSSITYTGVGRYRVNFSSSLANAYYGTAFSGQFPTEVGPVMPIINIDSTSGYGQTTGYVDVAVETAAGVIADVAQFSVLVFNAGTAPTTTYLLDSLGVSASGAWSVRQLKSSATKSMNVRRDSDNTTMDIGFVSGALDTATLLSFVGSNGGWVTKWYDQSGNGNDLVQTAPNSQPQIVSAGVVEINANGKNALFFQSNSGTGEVAAMTCSTSLFQAGAFTFTAAVQINNVTSYPSMMGTPNPGYGDSVSFGVESGTGNHYLSLFCDGYNNSNFTTPVTPSASQIIAVTSSAGVVTNTLTATGYVNNSSGGSATINTYASVVSGTSMGCPAGTTAEQWQGYMSEIIVFGAVLNSTQLSTVYTSQHGAF